MSFNSAAMEVSNLRKTLADIDQDHVLRFWDQLDAEGRQRLSGQLTALDLPAIAELARSVVRQHQPVVIPEPIQPVEAWPNQPDPPRQAVYQQAQQRGRELLAQGKVGAFLVAGGQGTRLGYDGPKGEFPVTPIKHKPLFGVFAQQIMAQARDAGRSIPWYIMTSDLNDATTRAFFASNDFFGLPRSDVFFFQQGMMPAFSLEGKMLLAGRDSLALSPDGHGGSLRALARSGALADMRRRGIEHLSYFQVDNPLVHCLDPLFLGLHELRGSEMSSKTIPKSDANEKVGNFVQAGQRIHVIEYSDLDPALAQRKNADGSLSFNAGSIAIHVLRTSFVERLNQGDRLRLPWHRALKKVPCLDERGNLLRPDKPNAVKLEQFVFDAVPLAENALIYTTRREEEFSPVKNASGADSLATSQRDQIRRCARWLRDCGVSVPLRDGEVDAVLEISPLLALDAQQLRARRLNLTQVKSGEKLYLD